MGLQVDGKYKYDEVLESLSDGISIQDRDFNIIYQNSTQKKFGGAHIGELCYNAYGEKESICPGCPLALTFADGKTHKQEKLAEKNGRKFFVEITTSPLRDEAGDIYAGIELVRDVTERHMLNEALKESEEKFRNLVEGAPIGVFIIQDGKVVYANPRISEISGYSADTLYNASPLEVIAPEDRDLVRANIEKLATGAEKSICHNYRYIRKDGTLADIENYAAGTLFNGRPAIIGTVQDITGRKTLEREKEDFYAMITHDLRSPLTSIIGYTQVIKELYKDRIDTDLLGMIEKIDNSSLMLSSMMEDFMTFSAIEHSKLEIVKTEEQIPELIESVYGEYMLTAANKGIKLKRNIGDGVSKALVDRNLIRRASCNLLQNALKYTRPGGTVTMNAEKILMDGVDSVAISFSDTGSGIPESERDKIFLKYYRSGSSKGTKGSGLGLAIVKSIAVAHGGKVELESTEGKGSVFTLIIPVKP